MEIKAYFLKSVSLSGLFVAIGIQYIDCHQSWTSVVGNSFLSSFWVPDANFDFNLFGRMN